MARLARFQLRLKRLPDAYDGRSSNRHFVLPSSNGLPGCREVVQHDRSASRQQSWRSNESGVTSVMFTPVYDLMSVAFRAFFSPLCFCFRLCCAINRGSAGGVRGDGLRRERGGGGGRERRGLRYVFDPPPTRHGDLSAASCPFMVARRWFLATFPCDP